MVDYSKNCSVLFFFENENGSVNMMHYERSQLIDDVSLNEEAKVNASDMIKKKLNGAKELIAIAIARSQKQHKDIMNKVSKKDDKNMKLTLNHLIEMKDHTNNLGLDVYQFFFMNLENNFLSKGNGTKRNLDILKDYDKEAQEFIILQLSHVREGAAADLMSELGIKRISIAKENQKHVDLNLH